MSIGSAGIVEVFLPAGGTAGQAVVKIDGQDYNFTFGAGGGGGGVQSLSAGTTQATGLQVVFSNSPTVSFGANGNTITASAAVAGGAGMGLSAGTQSVNTGTVIFANSNGISFGMSGSSQVTASYTVPSTAGLISALNLSAGTTSNNLSAVTFSNSNGISFGLNASTVTASYTVPTVTNSSWTVSDAATSGTVARLAFTNSNGLTLSLSTGAGGSHTVVGSYTVPSTAGLISAVNVSAGTTSNNLSAITFSNSNGISFGLNASTITASYTVPTQTNQTAGIYASSQTFGQSSSSTYDARSLSVVGSGDISVGWSNSSLLISGSTYPAQSNQTAGIYASSQTTGQSSSSTYDARSLTIVGSHNVSVGWSNGSLIIDATAGAGGGGFTGGVSTGGNTSGNTGTQTGQFILAGGNNITLSVSTAAGGLQTITISGANAGGAQTGISGIVVSNTTYTSGTVSFSNANGISFGSSAGQAITASYTVPSTAGLISAINLSAGTTSNNLTAVTFSNSGNVSFGLNGSTVTATVEDRIKQFVYPQPIHQTNFSISNATLSLQPFYMPNHMTATQFVVLMDLSGNSNSTGAITLSAGLYTMNGSTASLGTSGSRQLSWTSGSSTTQSSAYGGVSGTQYRTLAMNATMTPGNYLMALWVRTTNDGTWRIFGAPGVSIANALDTNQTNLWLAGGSTSSFTTAMPASINVTDANFVRTGATALRQPGFIALGTF